MKANAKVLYRMGEARHMMDEFPKNLVHHLRAMYKIVRLVPLTVSAQEFSWIKGDDFSNISEAVSLELENIFRECQGEIWSPYGEARDLINALGLTHTSMSVGDVIGLPEIDYHGGGIVAWRYYGVKPLGFEYIGRKYD